jgi:hypothetical protein
MFLTSLHGFEKKKTKYIPWIIEVKVGEREKKNQFWIFFQTQEEKWTHPFKFQIKSNFPLSQFAHTQKIEASDMKSGKETFFGVKGKKI